MFFFFRTLDASNEDEVKQGVTSQTWMDSSCFIKEKCHNAHLPIRLATLNLNEIFVRNPDHT